MLLENIDIPAPLAAENDEICRLHSKCKMKDLLRVSFWKKRVKSESALSRCKDDDLLGYAILKRHNVLKKEDCEWHVYESVMRKYPHHHNCIPGERSFAVQVAGSRFELPGVMYFQQNGLNKACAQVALKTLFSLNFPDKEISFPMINEVARNGRSHFAPGNGLDAGQIHSVLNHFGIDFDSVDYKLAKKYYRDKLPYQRLLYAGVESGAGALLGFQFAGPKARPEDLHIVPVFGHTFNQDTWVPNAEKAYFRVGKNTRYISSDAWMSSFICHDDNFGSNFCIPRFYIAPDQAQFVVGLRPPGAQYSGVIAEAVGLDYLRLLIPSLKSSKNIWLQRLIEYCSKKQQRVVLRAVAVSSQAYNNHLRSSSDWQGNREHRYIPDALKKALPSTLWIVEVSIPELFPGNKRKIGEIILDATVDSSPKLDFSTFLFGRFPGKYLCRDTAQKRASFYAVDSAIHSHTPLFTMAQRD